jgi:hypothetical protein
MARKLLIPLSAAVVGALITASPALADTTDCDGLQQAMDDAANGATVTLAAGSACTDSYTLPTGKDLVLEGGGDGATLAGDGESRLLRGSSVGETVIRNLRFEGGRASGSGGAILITGYEALTIEGNVFSDNDSGSDGGAVAIRPPIDSFGAAEARGAQGDEGPTPVTIADNVFGDGEGNRSDDGGGALSVLVFDDVALTGNVFKGNEARGQGGGASIAFCGDATVAGNTFEENHVEGPAGGKGSGGYAIGGGLWIGSFFFCTDSGPQLRESQSDVPESAVTQSGNTFRANSLATDDGGEAEGGGEFVYRVRFDSTDDVFHANAIGSGSTGYGGGLYVQSIADTVLRNFVATANTIQGGNGGGVRYGGETTTLSLVHATIAGNSILEGVGSAVWGQRSQTLLIDNSIVHGNTGGPELSGFGSDVLERGAAGEQAGGIEADFSLVCTADGQPFEGEGNLCQDPKLANVAGGDVHQTAASPTLEKASSDLSGGLERDYEGDARALDFDKANGAQPDMGADEAPAPADKPVDKPAATQQPAPAAGGVLGTQARSCTSRRSFRIKLRNRGQKVVKATVIVNGKRVKVLRGKRLTSRVDLRGLPKGRFSVRIKLRLANGKTLSGVRRYYTCRPGRPSGPPEV